MAGRRDRLDERPSARCVAECNRPRPGSMCAFCTSHQIGAPREHFEEFARRCSETCDREVRACWQACEGRGQRPR
ncbi:MAG: hypothetical protein EOO74_00165 [Myxococcales bacterium]|nr:MAG: hypothetical protein EOO74_00165 [Myxococcales bacterium]